MRRVLMGALLVVLAATSVSAGSTEEEARSAYEKGDYARAMALTRPLAEKGQAWAQNLLGWLYAEGKGVSQDDKEAVRWYRKAKCGATTWGRSLPTCREAIGCSSS